MARARWVVSVASPDGLQRTWRFAPGEVRVGRDASCGVRLDDARLSGVHLRLLLGEDTARVVDPGSRHGARLDRMPLAPEAPVALGAASVVEFCGHELSVTPEAEGGFTTDSRGTAERREAVELGLATVRGGLWTLHLLSPGPARHCATLGPEAAVLLGGSPRCDVAVPDAGLLPRQGRLSRREGGAPLWEVFGPEGEPQGMPVLLADGALLEVGSARLQVHGPGAGAVPLGEPASAAADSNVPAQTAEAPTPSGAAPSPAVAGTGVSAEGPAAAGRGSAAPVAPSPPRPPPDRLYTMAIMLAVVGGLLAFSAGVYALSAP